MKTPPDPMLRFVALCALALGVVGVLATAFTQPAAVPLGIAVGTALTLGNFWVSRRLVARMVEQSEQGGMGAAGLLALKMLTFFGLVYLAVTFLPLDVIGFVGGLMAVVLSIVIGNVFGPAPTVENTHG